MNTPVSKPNNNQIAVVCIVLGVGVTAYVFAASRSDPGLRMAALVAATSIGSALIAISSTLLTGKDLMHTPPDPKDLPDGSVQTETNQTTTQIPPIASNPTNEVQP